MASQQQQQPARKLWGGRFTGKTDPLMEKFNASISFDSRFYKADILGSQAYAKALARKNIITQEEASKLHEGLDLVLAEWEANTFKLEDGDEDIHTANERRLGELIGTHISGKLHTGRSRNDQVATDFRIWVRDEGRKLVVVLKQLIAAAVVRAQNEIDVIMPGYTHLQRAQPIRWSHLILAHAWSWHADCQRLEELLHRLNQLPLGSGALAGNPFQIDRDFLANELGFARVMPNSLYGVSDRDFVAEFLFWGSLTMVHISRFAEDLIIYSTGEFGFVQLADAYSTGSSLMPQKKNPDSLELLRGKSGRVFGGMSGFMMAYKGTPSTYNKDLQEDKEPVFDAYDTLMGSIQITTGVLATLKIRPEKMLASLSIDMLATDLAEYLVRKGVPFRETHHISGEAVRMAEERQCTMADLSLDDFKSLHPSFEADVANVWNFERSIENRCTPGGTSRATVQQQIEDLKEYLGLAGVSNVAEYLETHDLA
ncbi:argininosuccinate lyase [Haplosporangium bisporale]|nr:argininosuccinate lyase [Haplosporangium bisporale]KAF9208164.1 argininosuccinate lyase [Podila verticillata]KFH73959.1 argininosuccinate lyase [Podila verticillata NRRL 6337]